MIKVDVSFRNEALALFKKYNIKPYSTLVWKCVNKQDESISIEDVRNFFRGNGNAHGQLIMDCAYDLIDKGRKEQQKLFDRRAKLISVSK